MTKLHLDLGERGYDITVGRGLIHNADEIFNLNRRVLIVTDSGVPEEYAKTVCALAKEGRIFTLPEGEESKNMDREATLKAPLISARLSSVPP